MGNPCTAALFENAAHRTLLGCTITLLVGLAWATPQARSDPQKEASGTDSTVYRVGEDVKAPGPISTPLPMPPARTDKPRKVVVSFVVAPDGSVRDIKVVNRFRPDFDSAAVGAVATWKFQPATKAGKPVAVRIEAEIKFTPQ
jgi:TonB family protein